MWWTLVYLLQEFSANPGRQWMDGLLQSPDDGADQFTSSSSGRRFVDVFRWLHPTTAEAYTNWCTVTGARATNYGCRLDYIIADVGLVPSFLSCDIMADTEGSDHCPVRAEFDVCVVAARKCPALCTKYLPQFAGRQQTLAMFFGKQRDLGRPCSQDECPSVDSGSQQSSQSTSTSTISSSPSGTVELSANGVQSDKRSAAEELANVFNDSDSSGSVIVTKKMKLTDKLASVGNKQSSLLTFFSKHSLPDSTDREPVMSESQFEASDTNSTTPAHRQELTAARLSDSDTASKWKTLLKGPPQAPLCRGHQQPCILRTVKKEGPNKGKQFWVCCKPEGPKNNPDARCDHFVWVSNKKC